MALRETLRKRPAIAVVAAIAVICLALVLIFRQSAGGRSNGLPASAFYSVDDGETWFADDANLIPPFDYNGKQALKAEVFQCSSGKPFVGYLGRFVAASPQPAGGAGAPPAPGTATREYQVKLALTGDRGWVSSVSSAAERVCDPHCPDGSKEIPHAVFP